VDPQRLGTRKKREGVSDNIGLCAGTALALRAVRAVRAVHLFAPMRWL
jgi:hypothetical protein